MPRQFLAALVAVTLTASAAPAQGPLQRAGQALERTGQNIRNDVEDAVARGQMTARERELLARVTQRINGDKRLVNSTLQLVVQPDGTVYLRGSVANAPAKVTARELVENTIGVTRVVDELAVVKAVEVIESRPVVVAPRTVIVAPVESEVIVKP